MKAVTKKKRKSMKTPYLHLPQPRGQPELSPLPLGTALQFLWTLLPSYKTFLSFPYIKYSYVQTSSP